MARIGTYLQNALLNSTLRGTTFGVTSGIWASLHTSDPTDSTSVALANEVTGGSYVRQALSFGVPSGGITSTVADIIFPIATALWGNVGYICIFDAATSGNLLYHGPLSPPVTIDTTDQLRILTGNLTVQLTQYDSLFPKSAIAIGTTAESFNITGSNDQLSITIDGGTTQTFTLTHGSSRTAAQIASDLGALIGGAVNVATIPSGNYVRITTNSNNGISSTIDIGDPTNSARTTLGLATNTIGFPINNTFLGEVKQNIIDGTETNLLLAGWTTISGHGTTNLVMQSQISPDNLQMRLRIRDVGGDCAVFTIENVAGTCTGTAHFYNGGHILPATAESFRIIANRYQGFIFTANSTSTPKKYVSFGIPSLPTHLVGTIYECIWISTNSKTDTDTSLCPSFRSQLSTGQDGYGTSGYVSTIFNGINYSYNNNNNSYALGLLQFRGFTSGYKTWEDGSAFLFSPLLVFSDDGTNISTGKGYLWDAICSSDSYTADQTVSIDSHNFWILTQNTPTNSYAPGSLLVVVP